MTLPERQDRELKALIGEIKEANKSLRKTWKALEDSNNNLSRLELCLCEVSENPEKYFKNLDKKE